ncbi:MAG: Gx transporter family protein, partial [Oscillospiraceae bacterium]|nr:Gx transporter family protein [Oscillospiraceae bacterium]
MKTDVKKLALTGCLAGLALIIFVVEAQLPPFFIPGVKPGLSNVVVLFTIYSVGRKEAFCVLLIKVILGSVFAGSPVSFIFSFCGGFLACSVMCLASCILKDKQIWVCSVLGAVVHNFGQLVAALFVMKTTSVIA